jgi:hypothetical protein
MDMDEIKRIADSFKVKQDEPIEQEPIQDQEVVEPAEKEKEPELEVEPVVEEESKDNYVSSFEMVRRDEEDSDLEDLAKDSEYPQMQDGEQIARKVEMIKIDENYIPF